MGSEKDYQEWLNHNSDYRKFLYREITEDSLTTLCKKYNCPGCHIESTAPCDTEKFKAELRKIELAEKDCK